MDFIGSILNQMSSAFNQETAAEKKDEINVSISEDKTLKWRGLHHNTYAAKEGRSVISRRSKRIKSEVSLDSNDLCEPSTSNNSLNTSDNSEMIESKNDIEVGTVQDTNSGEIKNEDGDIIEPSSTNSVSVVDNVPEVTIVEDSLTTVIIEEIKDDSDDPEQNVKVESDPAVAKPSETLQIGSLEPDASENIFSQMSSAFNDAVAPNKEMSMKMADDKTLKWRALHNNQFASKEGRSSSRRSARHKNDSNDGKKTSMKEDENVELGVDDDGVKRDGRTSRRSKRFKNDEAKETETGKEMPSQVPSDEAVSEQEIASTIDEKEATTTEDVVASDNKVEDNVKMTEDKKSKTKINKTVHKSDRSLRSKHIDTPNASFNDDNTSKGDVDITTMTYAPEEAAEEVKIDEEIAPVEVPVAITAPIESQPAKKRGRKKKIRPIEEISLEKPKRGRKKKIQIPVILETEAKEPKNEEEKLEIPIKIESSLINTVEEVVENGVPTPEVPVKIPKKRGRKPKNIDADGNKEIRLKPSPIKKSPRLSRDGSESILASAIARQKNETAGTQTRLSRPIKLTAKILANEELRYGFEQQQNARLSLSSENLDTEIEIVPKKEVKSPQEEQEIFFAEPRSKNSQVKTNGKKVEVVEVKKIEQIVDVIPDPDCPFTFVSEEQPVIPTVTIIPTVEVEAPVVVHLAPTKKPCPDPQQFLNEIKLSKLGSHRSPDDNKKLNRKQQKRLSKQKEKHLQMLGLKKATKIDDSLSESEDTSDDGNEEFIPTKKINVGKPHVTLRLRNQKSEQLEITQQQPIATSSSPLPLQTPAVKPEKPHHTPGRPGRKRKAVETPPSTAPEFTEYVIHSDPQNVVQNKLILTKKKRPDEIVPVPPTNTIVEETIQPAAMVEFACNLICLCRQKSKYFIRKTKERSFCTAIDEIDEQKIGCCNELPGELLNLLRPSVRVSYMLLCDSHKKRLRAHNSCAGCGFFCTQGSYILCSKKHIFHRDCADKFILNTPYNPNSPSYACPTLVLKCPHCGVDAPNTDYKITMKCPDVPVFLPFQRGYIKPAKMIVPSNPVRSKNNFLINMEALIPNSVLDILVDANNKLKNREPALFSVKDFFYAIYNNNDIEKVAEIIASGFDLSTPFKEFHHGTCLHLVSNFGSLLMAYLILCRTNSVDFLNILDKEMRSAIMCAVLGSKNEILKLLIQSGADVTMKGPDGMTVLHLSAKIGNLPAAKIILDNYRENASTKRLQTFLNSVDDGNWTALVWAAENRHKDIVNYLINMGADVNICDLENNTVLHWAALSGCVETIYPILSSNCDPNIQNVNGETPLHIACRQSNTNICILLLSLGANLHIKNLANETPFDSIPEPDNDCAKLIGLNMEMRQISGICEKKVVCSDVSNGREKYPIQIVCSMECDEITPDFKYIIKNILLQNNIQVDTRISQMRVCSCSDNCISDSCQCGQISIQHWYNIDGRLISDFNYSDPPMIFECSDVCGCNKILCKNRVVQNGLKYPLQVIECEEKGKGWGAKSLIKILKGSFVSEYTGEILADCEADRRTDDSYFFDLGASEHCIDANYYGNVSRFFNHSCNANIVPIRVYFEHQDLRFPKIAFFASRDIEINEEICFDYGEKFWSVKYKTFPCSCRSPKCRYPPVMSSPSSSLNHQQVPRL